LDGVAPGLKARHRERRHSQWCHSSPRRKSKSTSDSRTSAFLRML